jgi:hypothetical protein
MPTLIFQKIRKKTSRAPRQVASETVSQEASQEATIDDIHE